MIGNLPNIKNVLLVRWLHIGSKKSLACLAEHSVLGLHCIAWNEEWIHPSKIPPLQCQSFPAQDSMDTAHAERLNFLTWLLNVDPFIPPVYRSQG